VAESDNADHVQGAVGVAVAASVKSVSHGFAARCFLWRDPAEFCERSVGPDVFGVAAQGEEQGGAVSGPTPYTWRRAGHA
jgi:hypothetical protein